MRRIAFLLLFFPSMLFAQQGLDSLDFACYELNRIENARALAPFLQELANMDVEKKEKIRITHIGDSHVQADYWTNSIRRRLQFHFGNAGRGLVFPYEIANTNGPEDIISGNFKVGNWDSKRNVFPKKSIPIGISGITIKARKDFSIDIDLLNPADAFDLILIFSDFVRSVGQFYMQPRYHQLNGLPRYTFHAVDEPIEQLLKAEATGLNLRVDDMISNSQFLLYGLYLEKARESGIVYNMIGVNGAQAQHYNQSVYFYKQLPFLNSDLYIISLGTNEALDGDLSFEQIHKDLDEMINRILKVDSRATFLLTTSPDHHYWQFGTNERGWDMRNLLIDYAFEKDLPYWDLYEIMGGYGSMDQWVDVGLAQTDHIHFNREGYDYIGQLFSIALLKSLHEVSGK